MRYKSIIIVNLLLLCMLQVQAQEDFCGIQNKCINNGEYLRFKVYYNLSALWVPAGEATFTTKISSMQNKPVYHITGKGSTYSSYDWIFKVRDQYETFIDTQTLKPLRFKRDVNEGGYKFKNDVTFYRNNNKAHSDGKMYDVPECVQDVLAAIYYARNIDYTKYKSGDKIPFSMFLDNEVHRLYIRYLGKEKIKTKYGTFNAIKIAPMLIEGTIFEGGEKMMIWVSDDNNHIPLRIDSPILVGSIKVDMIEYKNLKHPLKSQIKK